MKAIICPLYKAALLSNGVAFMDHRAFDRHCDGERCAWWSNGTCGKVGPNPIAVPELFRDGREDVHENRNLCPICGMDEAAEYEMFGTHHVHTKLSVDPYSRR